MINFFKKNKLNNSHYTHILNELNHSIISFDLEGNIITWNKSSTDLYGYDESEIVGKHISILYQNTQYEKLQLLINNALKNNYFRDSFEIITKLNIIKDIDLTLSLLYDKKGKPLYVVGYVDFINKNEQLTDNLSYESTHDSLTKLPNRHFLHKKILKSINQSAIEKTNLAIFFIDLDKFKQINDSLGHRIGDKVLQEVASRLQLVLREKDTLARLGGDEFTVIMENLKKIENASHLAQRILNVLILPILIEEHTLYISCSIGISIYPQDHTNIDKLIMYADTAMYKAKELGRNNFKFYSPQMTEIALEKITIENSLREAIKNKEFEVYYQPQVDGRDDTIIGVEALIRWNHPKKGIIPPFKFIPIAVETGLIVDIDRWVMENSMLQIKKWIEMGIFHGKLALNLAIKHLYEKDFLFFLQETIKKTNFDYSWLELEVSESEIMHNPESAIEILKEISKLGIEISIDDFGTGYSSLSYLKKLPIDKLKIDKSFINDLPEDEDYQAITKAIIALAQSLKLKLIAEGVETEEQKQFLLEYNCNEIQGYLYYKPIQAFKLETILQQV